MNLKFGGVILKKKHVIIILFVIVSLVVFSSIIYFSTKKYILENDQVKFYIMPETMEIKCEKDGKHEYVSKAGKNREVKITEYSDECLSWIEGKYTVNLRLENDYLAVSINSTEKGEFIFPKVKGEAYTIPIQEGKYVPATDREWLNYFQGNEEIAASFLSMQFLGVNHTDYGILYIIENMFNNTICFENDADHLTFDFRHDFTTLNYNEGISYRIYLTENDAEDMSKVYRKYIKEKDKFTSLNEKNMKNKNVEKLYGAPHIYLWKNEIIVPENVVDWKGFQEKIISDMNSEEKNMTNHIVDFFEENGVDESEEKLSNFKELYSTELIYDDLKRMICVEITSVICSEDFYNQDMYRYLDAEGKSHIKRGIENLTLAEKYELNKNAFFGAYGEYLSPVETRGNGFSRFMIDELKKAGIDKAWFGLDKLEIGLYNSPLIDYVVENGFVIGPYDGYDSIHEPGKENWITASFEDKSLYYEAAVMKENGEYISGFLGIGRILNPVYSMQTVKKRVGKAFENDVNFNSWFVDCDACGDFF